MPIKEEALTREEIRELAEALVTLPEQERKYILGVAKGIELMTYGNEEKEAS